jgi:hypothetical protein
MGIDNKHELGSKAVLLLATAVVVVLGLAGCSFVILVSSPNAQRDLLILAGCALGCGVLLWLLRDRPPEANPQHSRWKFWKRPPPKKTYVLKRVKVLDAGTGTNRPPTAESVRELSEGNLNTWVPSGLPRRETPPRDEPS